MSSYLTNMMQTTVEWIGFRIGRGLELELRARYTLVKEIFALFMKKNSAIRYTSSTLQNFLY